MAGAYVISGDQGFLPAPPVSVKQLSLAPGERRKIPVDMTNGDEVSDHLRGSAGQYSRSIRGFFEPSSILAISTPVLTLRPTGLLPLVTDNSSRCVCCRRRS